MIILDVIVHETLWGGRKFEKHLSDKVSKIGHLYSVYCRKGISNTVLNGEYKGKYFNELFDDLKQKYNMKSYEYFPLTIALVDAADDLSIQVHPDEAAAVLLEEKNIGKRESWYFIDKPASGKIYCGCSNSLSEVKGQITDNEIEKITDTLPVEKGDYIFVEPGTLHALTSGSLVYEIEEGSDFTYRFFDYNRMDEKGNSRELHLEKASIALNSKIKSEIKRYQNELEIIEKTYSTKRITNRCGYENHSKDLECLTVTQGEFVYDDVNVTPGMTIIMEPGEKLEHIDIIEAIIAKKR